MKRVILEKNIWGTKKYFQRINSLDDLSHPGFERIRYYFHNLGKILDVGCADGTKLATLGDLTTQKWGIDIGDAALKAGKQKHPEINFSKGEGEKLPFRDNFFDGVVSTFVLEHTKNPRRVILEMKRVAKKGGLLIILAPNYGAPNRASPNFTGSRIKKFLANPKWHMVQPKKSSMENFETDDDTTYEPYFLEVKNFMQANSLEILETSSFWQMEEKNPKPWQKMLRLVGEIGLYPFNYWGPHLFIVARKTK